jgi:hypothetical protein
MGMESRGGTIRKKKLGELLCEKAYLDENALRVALEEQKVKHRQLGQILIELGYITQIQLTEALAIQAGIERVDLSDVSIGGEIIGLVPADMVSKYNILPLWRQNGRLAVAMIDPFQPQMMEDLRLVTGCLIQRFYAEPSQLEHAVLKFYGSNVARMLDNLAPAEQQADENAESGDFSPAKLSELAREPSLVNLVNLIIFEAIESRASDIHIEPFEREVKIKYRVDGILIEKAPSSKRLHAAIVSRIKIMANMNIAERFVPQDGHIEFTSKKGRVDIRVSTVPTVWGEGVALRLLDRSASLIHLEDLGMTGLTMEGFSKCLKKTHGIVLVTGPTGSGKTTTLYAALNKIYSPGVKMITIEDPVEYQLDGINQMPVNPKRGLTFATGLRHILRHDPDIIMVGEIRPRDGGHRHPGGSDGPLGLLHPAHERCARGRDPSARHGARTVPAGQLAGRSSGPTAGAENLPEMQGRVPTGRNVAQKPQRHPAIRGAEEVLPWRWVQLLQRDRDERPRRHFRNASHHRTTTGVDPDALLRGPDYAGSPAGPRGHGARRHRQGAGGGHDAGRGLPRRQDHRGG